MPSIWNWKNCGRKPKNESRRTVSLFKRTENVLLPIDLLTERIQSVNSDGWILNVCVTSVHPLSSSSFKTRVSPIKAITYWKSLKSIFSSFLGTSSPRVKRQLFRYCIPFAPSIAFVRSFAVPSVDVADFRRFDLLLQASLRARPHGLETNNGNHVSLRETVRVTDASCQSDTNRQCVISAAFLIPFFIAGF